MARRIEQEEERGSRRADAAYFDWPRGAGEGVRSLQCETKPDREEKPKFANHEMIGPRKG